MTFPVWIKKKELSRGSGYYYNENFFDEFHSALADEEER